MQEVLKTDIKLHAHAAAFSHEVLYLCAFRFSGAENRPLKSKGGDSYWEPPFGL